MPALVVRLLEGSGRVNVGQGIVMTVQGAGAALSPALGGILAHRFGYPAAFIALGAVSAGSLVLWRGIAQARLRRRRRGARSGRRAVRGVLTRYPLPVTFLERTC